MAVALSEISSLRQLYTAGVLKPVDAASRRYPARAVLLDRVSLYQGDITRLDVDSIVNAAKQTLLGGGGVDGAIHAAAGPALLEECRQLNGCDTGNAKITKGYDLPARHVIHTVGPIYAASKVDVSSRQLASCYKTSLQLAVDNSLKHIAFPSVSTGIYGYPVRDATHIALDVTRTFLESEDGDKLGQTIFVVWSDADKAIYESLLPLYFPLDHPAKDPEAQPPTEGMQ